VPKLAYLRRFDDTKRVTTHLIRRMTDNTMVKRVTRHLMRRMTDNTMVKRKRTKQQPVTEWVLKKDENNCTTFIKTYKCEHQNIKLYIKCVCKFLEVHMGRYRKSQVEAQYVILAVYQIWEIITLIVNILYPRYEY
jgi:hypothetical protein